MPQRSRHSYEENDKGEKAEHGQKCHITSGNWAVIADKADESFFEAVRVINHKARVGCGVSIFKGEVIWGTDRESNYLPYM